ncbi:MAG: TlpA disulfide reductase family protein [Psychromonas sp.]
MSAPPLMGQGINNHTAIALKDYLGKVVLIDFWASWCAPCRRALPELNSLRNKYKNFEVLAINLDKNSEDAKYFLKQYPVQYPILINVPVSQINAYQIEGLPVSYLIDKKGKIIKRFVGFKKSYLQKIEDFLLKQ